MVRSLWLMAIVWGQSGFDTFEPVTAASGEDAQEVRRTRFERNLENAKAPVGGGTGPIDDVRLPNLCTNGSDHCWPQSFILGGQKCGSSSLFSVMKSATFRACGAQVPPHYAYDHEFPGYYRKESHFFDQNDTHTSLWGPADAFTSLYSLTDRPQCIRNGFIESTPNYLHSWDSPSLLASMMPIDVQRKVRFVIVLREPISRDLSSYNHQAGDGLGWSSVCPVNQFATYGEYNQCSVASWKKMEKEYGLTSKDAGDGNWSAVGPELLPMGMYVRHLKQWASHISRSQIFVCEMGAMLSDPRDYVARIARFLRFTILKGVPGTQRSTNSRERGGSRRLRKIRDPPVQQPLKLHNHFTFAHSNEKKFPRKVVLMSCEVRDVMQTIYQPYNEALYEMLREDRAKMLQPHEEPPFPEFAPCKCSENGEVRYNGEGSAPVSNGTVRTKSTKTGPKAPRKEGRATSEPTELERGRAS